MNISADHILLTKFYQLNVPPKEVTRSIHKIVAFLYLASRGNFFPKAIDDTPSDERTGYFNDSIDSHFGDTSENVRSVMILGGHQARDKKAYSDRQKSRRGEGQGDLKLRLSAMNSS